MPEFLQNSMNFIKISKKKVMQRFLEVNNGLNKQISVSQMSMIYCVTYIYFCNRSMVAHWYASCFIYKVKTSV